MAVFSAVGLFLRLHTLPERMAHKLQFKIVAVLGLLAVFTHQHILGRQPAANPDRHPRFRIAAAQDGRIPGKDRPYPAGRGGPKCQTRLAPSSRPPG